MKSMKEGGKSRHKTVELTWLGCNMCDSHLPQELDSTCISLVLQWLDTLMSIKVNFKEQVEITKLPMPPFARWISEFDVSAFLTATPSKETLTKTDLDQGRKGITHILHKRVHGSVLRTQTTIEKLFGLLGSVFLVEENDGLRLLELEKKSTMWPVKILMMKHGLELRYCVWEPRVVAAFTWDMDDAIKRNQRRKHYEKLFALAINYMLFGTPRPPEQSSTERGSSNKGWDGHDKEVERHAGEVRDMEKQLSCVLPNISSTKIVGLHVSVLCWDRKASTKNLQYSRNGRTCQFASTLRTRLISKATVGYGLNTRPIKS